MRQDLRELLTGFLVTVIFGGILMIVLWYPQAPPADAGRSTVDAEVLVSGPEE